MPTITVTATDMLTNLTQQAVTGTEVDYRFLALPIGTYRVQVAQTGFRTFVADNIVLTGWRPHRTLGRADPVRRRQFGALLLREQEGNQFVGTHQGDFVPCVFAGAVSGDDVHIASSIGEVHGAALSYRFTGKLNGDSMSGTLGCGRVFERSVKEAACIRSRIRSRWRRAV
jgi:hypothetical protein